MISDQRHGTVLWTLDAAIRRHLAAVEDACSQTNHWSANLFSATSGPCPAKEKSPNSLPDVFSSEQLSKTMSNPRYADDILKLDRIYEHSVINKETVII